jgi:hypothetical protein
MAFALPLGSGNHFSSQACISRIGDATLKYPLAFNQEQRLVSEEMRWYNGLPTDPFHAALALSLEGSLDSAALEKTLNTIIERHAGLRAAFFQVGNKVFDERRVQIVDSLQRGMVESGLYVQQVMDNAHITIAAKSIESLNAEAQQDEIAHTLNESMEENSDYVQPPFMRACLFRLASDSHLLVLVINHIICDMLSLMLIKKEIALIYAKIKYSVKDPLPEIRRHFPDFALQQRRRAKNHEYDAAISYWRKQLANYWTAQIQDRDLSSEFRGVTVGPMTPGSDLEIIPLDKTLIESMKRFAHEKKISLNILFVSACMILLHMIRRKSAAALYSNFANRVDPDYMNTVGWFSNIHLLGIELSDNATVNDVLMSARDAVFNAITYQDAPISLVMDRMYTPHNSPREQNNAASHNSPPSANNLVIICDMINYAQYGNREMNACPLRIKHASLPGNLIGTWARWASALIIGLSYFGDRGHLSATYPLRLIGKNAVSNLLNEVAYIIGWCIDNSKSELMNYPFGIKMNPSK